MAKGITKILSSAKKSKFSYGAAFSVGMSAYGAKSSYEYAKQSGHSTLGATAAAVGEFAIGEILGFGYIPYQAMKAIPSIAVKGAEGLGKMQRQMDKSARAIPFQNAMFNDFNQAFTMRQAGMKAAEQSKYNLQQTLMGNEASLLRK